MATVDFTSVATGARFSNFHPDLAVADYFHVFPAQPSSVTIANIGTGGISLWVDKGTAGQVYVGNVTNRGLGPGDSFSLAWPTSDANYAGIGFNAENSTSTLHLRLTYVTPPPSPCAYGTETNPDAQIYSAVTAALLDTLALFMGWGPLVIMAMDTLIGAPILFPTCDHPPPAVPDPINPNLLQSAEHLGALFANALWHFYCQCTPAPPGSAAPIPYDLPSLPPALTTGVLAPLVCNNEDICATLNSISVQLAAIQAQVTYARADVTLIQRQHVPFGYVPGPTHSGLTGMGFITVQGILALSVLSTAVPTYLGLEIGAPDENIILGHISLGNADGYERRITVTHAAQLITDINPTITSVGYVFAGGVTATIQELLREPS